LGLFTYYLWLADRLIDFNNQHTAILIFNQIIIRFMQIDL